MIEKCRGISPTTPVLFHVPALRERPEDIADIAEYCLEELCERYGKEVRTIARDAADYLERREWRYNMLELRHFLEGVIMFMDSGKKVMTKADILSVESLDTVSGDDEIIPLNEKLGDYEKVYIIKALRKNGGNRAKTARELDISIRSLHYKLSRHRI